MNDVWKQPQKSKRVPVNDEGAAEHHETLRVKEDEADGEDEGGLGELIGNIRIFSHFGDEGEAEVRETPRA